MEAKKTKEEEHKVVDLQLLPGGKGTGGPNWLMKLNCGDVFLVRPKFAKQFNLDVFRVEFKGIRVVQLANIASTGLIHYWVESSDFSDAMELIEVINDEQDE